MSDKFFEHSILNRRMSIPQEIGSSTTLNAEISEEARNSSNSDVPHPFHKPDSGRIAVNFINHLGDEVMKVF